MHERLGDPIVEKCQGKRLRTIYQNTKEKLSVKHLGTGTATLGLPQANDEMRQYWLDRRTQPEGITLAPQIFASGDKPHLGHDIRKLLSYTRNDSSKS